MLARPLEATHPPPAWPGPSLTDDKGVGPGMTRRFSALAVAMIIAGCANRPTPPEGQTRRVDPGLGRVTEVVYTPPTWPRALKADIYQPRGAGPWPGVLLIHGGSWSSADNRWHMRLLARKLARRGFVVMNATYRGTPDFHFPAPIDDLREALRWWRAHAAEHGLRSDKVAAYGFSAGGHLAAFIAVQDAPADERVQAAVLASAPTDLTLYPESPITQRFLGTTPTSQPALFRAASPVAHVTPDDPPVFQYHGTDDTTVSPEHTRTFKAALDRAGVRNELRWMRGRAHASVLIFGGAAEDAAIDFLDTVLR